MAKFVSYLGGRQVAKARIGALDGRLLDDDICAQSARTGFAIAQVTRSDAVLSLVETVGPVR